jgi:hypothetical protein
LGAINQRLWRWSVELVSEEVAKAIGFRFEYCHGVYVGHFLRRVGPAWSEGNFYILPSLLGRCLDSGTPAERLAMGTRGYLNHILYRWRKLGGQ